MYISTAITCCRAYTTCYFAIWPKLSARLSLAPSPTSLPSDGEGEEEKGEKGEEEGEKMEDKQSGEHQHRSRTKPPAAAPASSHSTKRKTPAVGGDAQEAGDSFTELVEKAEAVTANTFIIQGRPAKSNAGKRELESPSPAQVKRLKSETVYAEADVDVLPGGLLAKVPLKNHCSLQIFPGPRVFLVHDVAGLSLIHI